MRKQKVYQEFVYLMPGGNLNTTISIHSVAERNMKKKNYSSSLEKCCTFVKKSQMNTISSQKR